MAISRFCDSSKHPYFYMEDGHFEALINYYNLVDFCINIDTGNITLYGADEKVLFGPTNSVEECINSLKSLRT